MPTETLALKTGQRVHDRVFPQGQLIFHDDVNDRMKLRIWQRDLIATMVGSDQLDSFAFVGPEPIR